MEGLCSLFDELCSLGGDANFSTMLENRIGSS